MFETMNPQIFLKPDKDRLPQRHHAWIFSGAISRTEGSPSPGGVVEVRDSTGGFIAWGQYNPGSQIRVRLLDWERGTVVDEGFYRTRLIQALSLRQHWAGETQALRLVFSEGDGLPGLVADRYGNILVLQLLTAGMERLRDLWVRLFRETLPELEGVYEKSDGDGRRQEGLPEVTGWLWRSEEGIPASTQLWIRENGLEFRVDLEGQKTGYYADQRLNRLRTASYAVGRKCADVFSFAGGFSCRMMAAGAASVTLLDGSQEALDLASENLKKNGFSPEALVCGDAFQVLREWKSSGRRFGLISLDPPKLVTSRTGLEKGLKAYKDLNLQALHLLEPGGILATFSCSGLVSRADFLQAVNYAVRDSGRRVQILEHLSQGPDHPVITTHPEGEYLKGLILRAL